MGTVVQLDPSSNRSGAVAFANTGGGSLVGALSDVDPATYIRKNDVNGSRTFEANVDNYTIGAGTRVKRVRAFLSHESFDFPTRFDVGFKGGVTGGVLHAGTTRNFSTANNGGGSGYTVWMTNLQNSTGGFPQALVNSLWLTMTEYKDDGSRARFRRAYIELDVIDQPTVTVDAPSGTIQQSRPEVTWTYADGDGDAETKYELKVFTAAQYGALDFDPDLSDSFWETGEVEQSGESVTVGVNLPNDDFRAYVRAAHDGGASDYWSEWDYSSFDVDLTQPAPPTLVVVQEYVDTEVEATVSGAALVAGLSAPIVRLQRSDDAGVTWSDVRLGYYEQPVVGTWSATLTDYEATRGVELSYRAQVIAYDFANEAFSQSEWSTTATVTPEDDGRWFFATWTAGNLIVAPWDGFIFYEGAWSVLTVSPVDEPVTEKAEPGSEGTFRPLGRTGTVVVSDNLGTGDGAVEFVATPETYDDLLELTNAQVPVLMRLPDSAGARWIAWVGDRERLIEPGVRGVSVSYVGIDAPPVS